MSVEVALISLGTAAVRTATTLWLGNHQIAAAVGTSVIDQLSAKLTKVTDRRQFARTFDNFAEAVAERLEPIINAEFRSLPENERLAAINAVQDTFAKASLRDEDLFAADLDAGHLDRSIRAPELTTLLSADGTALYDLLLRECCGYVIEIARGLPAFSTSALTELLRRDREIIDGIREVLARLPQRDRGTGFDYDYRQLVARKLDHVEMFGLTLTDASRRYPLSVAYIGLTASTDESGPARRVEEHLTNARRVFIRGEAGLGKTTLLQWIAVRSARNDFPSVLSGWHGTIPFFVSLRRYVRHDLPAPERFLDEVGRHIADEMPQGWVQAKLRSGNAVVLVDGVDELPESRRDDVRRWLRDLIAAFRWARFVVTSRPGATEPTWLQAEDFTVLALQPMGRQDVREFIQRWHDAIRSVCVDHDARAEIDQYQADLIAQIDARSHLRKLARYPLLCALSCALNRDRRSSLPTNRMELYEVALQLLLERLDAERRIETVPGLGRYEKILLLGDLAYWLIRNGHTEIDRERVITRFDHSLRAMPHVPTDGHGVYAHLLARSGLMREPAAGRVDFVHRTFQEYLAAAAAIDADDIGTLVANAHLDQWHEVLVMAVGHASRRQRAELVSGLLQRGNLDLLTLACLETAPELSPDLHHEIRQRAARLLPPRSLDQAALVAAAGDYVLDLLAECAPTTEAEVVATIRALAETASEDAVPIIARHAADDRDGVFLEILRSWGIFDDKLYAEAVLTRCGSTTIKLDSASAVHAVRHLPRLTGVIVPYEHALFSEYGALPRTLNLTLVSWPASQIIDALGEGWQSNRLELRHMVLDDLGTFDFVDHVTELQIHSCHLRSLAGIERWQDCLQQLEVVRTIVPHELSQRLLAGIPGLRVVYTPFEPQPVQTVPAAQWHSHPVEM